MICDLGSSRFVTALAHPLSCVTVLREAAFAEDAGSGRLAELGRLFGMMADEDLVECDDEVFPGLCEADHGAQSCFQIFDRLMEGVTDWAVIESFKVETIVANNIRNQIRDQRPTFVVGVPEPVFGNSEPVPAGFAWRTCCGVRSSQ
jgi:hypothetical protein